ncbi:hypothetical protein [Glutamicibacter protophormiae]
MWSIDAALIEDWIAPLDAGSRAQVFAALLLPEESSPELGRPIVDTVTASRHRNLKELQPGSTGRSELRSLSIRNDRRSCS